ncbi:glycosyltransferase family 2 protein [Nodularia sp. NIES-3585]|uniref:glycosyltransferase family 2 protein n=1 Tax=Nodularia sp. NIES-3585 TaxID=1973477 RepID=UPI000B5C3D23|nr:glycosyltransferase family 2 protein [Nodularia sp. NIES-3585]GAX34315.1 family 2 glycosyl transferase [Nodularia sp. NIES-3585]
MNNEILSEINTNSSKLISDVTFPRITIITPSYNQGHFIEETIRSVVTQDYPNLEYIIIDGGSKDNTVEIIQQYEKLITYWVSEPDNGQTHAINKGLAKATGEIIAYLNSDDYYLPGTLFKVAEYFCQFPDTDLLNGRCRYVNEQGKKIGDQFGNIEKLEEILDLWGVWWRKRQFVQPEVFWSRKATEKVGFFKEELNYVMDYDYWCRILQVNGIVGKIDAELTCFRFTATQKSNHSIKVAEELLGVVQPLLWNKSLKISLIKRLLLQGNWLYQSIFLKEVENSVIQRHNQVMRWVKLFLIVMRYPKLIFASSFYKRVYQILL